MFTVYGKYRLPQTMAVKKVVNIAVNGKLRLAVGNPNSDVEMKRDKISLVCPLVIKPFKSITYFIFV